MPATALIKITQGPNTAPAGEAVLGTLSDGAWAITNGDNTGVTSWEIWLLDAPPDTALYAVGTLPVLLASAANNSPSFAIAQPDVRGPWRVMLIVRDVGGTEDRDIRCFGVPDARGFVAIPYQKHPDPLPLAPIAGIDTAVRPVKPDEQNYGNNPRGWEGDQSAGQMASLFRRLDDLPRAVIDSTPGTLVERREAPLYFVDLDTIAGNAVVNLPTNPVAGYRRKFLAGGPVDVTRIASITPGGGGNVQGLSAAQLLGGQSCSLVHRGSNVWDAVGSRLIDDEQLVVTGVANSGITTFEVIGTKLLDPRLFPNKTAATVNWTVTGFTTNAGDPAEVRLFDITAAAVVAGSVLSFPELIATTKSAAVTLPDLSHQYEAHLRCTNTGDPNRALCTRAAIHINWLRT